ncbi:MAG: crossover junction endodeoxyribonuclease RuvC [Treponema sp.]|jgi:crossover junction endodeoxyribonuclease RuvC|nr:crossover junction endodeoxyribonuclease RuvC [Treponema sp.]
MRGIKRESFSVSGAPQDGKCIRRILGIDPGLASTGWGVVDNAAGSIVYIDHGTIVTKAGCPRSDRLFFILQRIRSIIKKFNPTEAAIETLYFGKNVSSAIPVAEARGVISAAIAERGIPLLELTPNAIKLGVAGHARADKEQVQEMVRIILNLDEIPRPDHSADALGAAICAANSGAVNSGG